MSLLCKRGVLRTKNDLLELHFSNEARAVRQAVYSSQPEKGGGGGHAACRMGEARVAASPHRNKTKTTQRNFTASQEIHKIIYC